MMLCKSLWDVAVAAATAGGLTSDHQAPSAARLTSSSFFSWESSWFTLALVDNVASPGAQGGRLGEIACPPSGKQPLTSRADLLGLGSCCGSTCAKKVA